MRDPDLPASACTSRISPTPPRASTTWKTHYRYLLGVKRFQAVRSCDGSTEEYADTGVAVHIWSSPI
jgi:hypothetical protein